MHLLGLMLFLPTFLLATTATTTTISTRRILVLPLLVVMAADSEGMNVTKHQEDKLVLVALDNNDPDHHHHDAASAPDNPNPNPIRNPEPNPNLDPSSKNVIEWKIVDATDLAIQSMRQYHRHHHHNEVVTPKKNTNLEEHKDISFVQNVILPALELTTLSYIKTAGISNEDDMEHLADLSTSISRLELFLAEFNLDTITEFLPPTIAYQVDGHMKTMRSAISRVLTAAQDVTRIVQDSSIQIPAATNHKANRGTSNPPTNQVHHDLKRRPRHRYLTNDDSLSISKGEYEMRARGYHGFMAEDRKIDSFRHAPGGSGMDSFINLNNESFLHTEGFGTFYRSPGHHSAEFGNPSSNNFRRLNADGICVSPDKEALRVERCTRLYNCAKEYSMYDLFVYYFGDNVDDITGEINLDSVFFFDEENIITKYVDLYNSLYSYDFDPSNQSECDKLLQYFHRYDESKKKWVGGSVTSVCRSWGSTKKVSLKSIYNFLRDRYLRPVNEGGTTEMKEVFPDYLPPGGLTSYDISYFPWTKRYQMILVTHSGDLKGKYLGIKPTDDGVRNTLAEITCQLWGNRKIGGANDVCFFTDYYAPDGKIQFTAFQPDAYLTYSLYDWRTFVVVGELYRELLTCAKVLGYAVSASIYSSSKSIDLNFPWMGFDNSTIFDNHGRLKRDINPDQYYKKFPNHDNTGYISYSSFSEYFTSDDAIANGKYYVENFLDVIDTMSNLMFGNETTIGQVCSYAKAFGNGVVTELPGYCCLDAPDETKFWGESYGVNKGNLRPVSDCNHVGPWWASFNEAACNPFGGTWCPNPRNCRNLLVCLSHLKEDARYDSTSQPFFTYLDEAPRITDADSTTQCGDLREYFEFDRDYPDDDRICEELQNIQCRDDFSNLGEKTGSTSVSQVQLRLETLMTRKLAFYDKDKEKEFKTAVTVASAAVSIASAAKEHINTSTEQACLAFISGIPGTASPCTFALTTVKIIALVVWLLTKAAYEVINGLYGSIVTKPDISASRELQEINYANLITSGNNGAVLFKAVAQLKQLIGALDSNVDVLNEGNSRRLTNKACDQIDLTHICFDNIECSCEDHRYLCDCTPNWAYIKVQSGAGCDNFDSDGDLVPDNCEDHFPPSIFLTNSNDFQCDKNDPAKLCYSSFTFQTHEAAENYIRSKLVVTDDCAIGSQLSYSISHVIGTSCSNTTYVIQPYQNYEYEDWFVQCDGAYTNPLYGEEKYVSMQVDDSDPDIECGFYDVHIDTPYIEVDGKYLYHRNFRESNVNLLSKSLFWYSVKDNCEDEDVTVSIEVKTNELQYQGDVVRVFPYQYTGYVMQVEVLYSPADCDILNNRNISCSGDSTLDPRFRLYEIEVKVEDSSSRFTKDTCTIVIIPECEDPFDAENCEMIGGRFFFKKTALLDQMSSSIIRYKLASQVVSWDFALNDDFSGFYTNTYSPSLQPSRMPSVQPTSYPSNGPSKYPSHEPSSLPSSLSSSNPSAEPSDQPSSHPSISPSIQPSDEPSTVPSKLPSDSPSFQPTLSPSDHPSSEPSYEPSTYPSDVPSTVPSTLPSEIPSSQPTLLPSDHPSSEPSTDPSVQPSSVPSVLPSVIPSAMPSLNPSSSPSNLPTFFPVVECGFRDTSHIDVVVNKTLFFYSNFDGRDGLMDSQFFFEVMDKGTDTNSYNNITVQVKSNEFETGKYDMSSLEVNIAATTDMDRVRFNFLVRDCKNGRISKDSKCTTDPTIEYPIRFYEILVKTIDPYGRSDDDICHVVIVSKCDPKYDPYCVDFVEEHHEYHHDLHDRPNVDHTHHSKSGKLRNQKDHPDGKYPRLNYLGELVQRSSTRFHLTSLELQWTF